MRRKERSLFVVAEIVPGALMNERADLAEVGGELLVEVLRSVVTNEFWRGCSACSGDV